MERKKMGRPPIPEDERQSLPVSIRLSQALRDKLARLGGPEWVRERIRKAKEPPESGQK